MSPSMTKPINWFVGPAKTQVSLGIRPVWSESSLSAQWVAKDPRNLHADAQADLIFFFFFFDLGRKQEISEKNHLTTPKQNLACLTCAERGSNAQQWDDEQFRALKISSLNHSAMGAAQADLRQVILLALLCKPNMKIITTLSLTHICLVGFSCLINWTSPFPNLEVSAELFCFHFISNRNSCKQTVKTLIRRSLLGFAQSHYVFLLYCVFLLNCKHSLCNCLRRNLSCDMTKPTKWVCAPAKTQISLGIHPVWSVFSVRSMSS